MRPRGQLRLMLRTGGCIAVLAGLGAHATRQLRILLLHDGHLFVQFIQLALEVVLLLPLLPDDRVILLVVALLLVVQHGHVIDDVVLENVVHGLLLRVVELALFTAVDGSGLQSRTTAHCVDDVLDASPLDFRRGRVVLRFGDNGTGRVAGRALERILDLLLDGDGAGARPRGARGQALIAIGAIEIRSGLHTRLREGLLHGASRRCRILGTVLRIGRHHDLPITRIIAIITVTTVLSPTLHCSTSHTVTVVLLMMVLRTVALVLLLRLEQICRRIIVVIVNAIVVVNVVVDAVVVRWLVLHGEGAKLAALQYLTQHVLRELGRGGGVVAVDHRAGLQGVGRRGVHAGAGHAVAALGRRGAGVCRLLDLSSEELVQHFVGRAEARRPEKAESRVGGMLLGCRRTRRRGAQVTLTAGRSRVLELLWLLR